jgi:Flp pilus assembly protein TadG
MRKHSFTKVFHSRRGRAGTIMLEFALGTGLLVAAFGGTFVFGYTFYQYNSLANAVNDGARYASLIPYASTTATPKADFLQAVQNMVVYGDPAGGTAPVAPGLTTDKVQLRVTFPPTLNIPTAMTVYINGYQIDSLFAQNKLTLNNKPQVTYPYVGIYSPY